MRKHRWSCEEVERIFTKICEDEMRQRLAEIFDLMLNQTRQLRKNSVFSKNSNFLDRDFLSKQRKESA